MKIQSIELATVAVPLRKPFKTALRTVHTAYSTYVKVTTEDGKSGWGEAPPTHVITGDSMASIAYAIEEVMAPKLIGMDIRNRSELFAVLHKTIMRNTSAKAAVDMAIHDLLGQLAELPLYQFLGGDKNKLDSNFTVSVNDPQEMADDAFQYTEDGFTTLKVKVGIGSSELDIERVKAIRNRVGHTVKIRLDANQGWHPKEAIRTIAAMEDAGLEIELVEQPVHAEDIDGLLYVTQNTLTPIMADESVFSPRDALRVLQCRAADLINIKLMKSGGIHEALKINALAESYGVQCMTGSMIETKLGITAAAHFAASQPNITRCDFDAPLMLNGDPVIGGVTYSRQTVQLPDMAGLGVQIDTSWLTHLRTSGNEEEQR
ncbi:dipeptide epimerase [Sporosarcina sp. BI001-red]|uniref:mandelate racemase/muconate lactonizing enzyme family protein n=1 Tax=Sporosarcina sp. BI001-red TaxID=2282866 RepID=UPI000E286C2A|nr:dipeptide epimerase [Sporosarcina sp. BI001-red]REB08039.1 dipeptide epimerase [Sporosarcina sp. BI001-red]